MERAVLGANSPVVTNWSEDVRAACERPTDLDESSSFWAACLARSYACATLQSCSTCWATSEMFAGGWAGLAAVRRKMYALSSRSVSAWDASQFCRATAETPVTWPVKDRAYFGNSSKLLV